MGSRKAPSVSRVAVGFVASFSFRRRMGLSFIGLMVNSARSFLSQKRETIIIILALSLWTPCLLLTLGLRSGIERKVDHYLTILHPPEGLILYKKAGVPLDKAPGYSLRQKDLEALRRNFSNIALFSGSASVKTDVSAQGKTVDVVLSAVEPEYYRIQDYTMLAGSLPDEQDESTLARVCVVGETLAKNMGLGANPIGKTVFVWGVPFTVKGLRKDEPVLASEPLFNRNRYFQIPFRTGNRILFREDGPDIIIFLIRPGHDVQSATKQIEQFVLSRHPNWSPGKAPLRVVTGLSGAARIKSTVRPLLISGAILATLSFLAGFAILATVLLMYVSQSRREIAIKRALGASQRAVKAEFTATATLLCLSAMTLGLFLWGVAYWLIQTHPIREVSGLPKYPIAFSRADVLIVLLVNLLGLVLSLRAGLRFITRISPAEALRG